MSKFNQVVTCTSRLRAITCVFLTRSLGCRQGRPNICTMTESASCSVDPSVFAPMGFFGSPSFPQFLLQKERSQQRTGEVQLSCSRPYSQSRGRRCGTPRMSTMENTLKVTPTKAACENWPMMRQMMRSVLQRSSQKGLGIFVECFWAPINIRKHEAAYVLILVMLANQVSPSPSKRLRLAREKMREVIVIQLTRPDSAMNLKLTSLVFGGQSVFVFLC